MNKQYVQLLALNSAIVVLFIVAITVFIAGIYSNDPVPALQNIVPVLDVYPARWTLVIAWFVYSWQVSWIIYSLILVCRSSPHPVLLTPLFLGIYFLALVIQIAINSVAFTDIVSVSFVGLLLISVTLFASLAISYIALYQNRTVLVQQNRRVDDALIRGLVQNGIGLYATWTSMATFITMAVLVVYRSDPIINQNTASSVVIAFIAAFLVAYTATDLTVLDKYSRYTFTPYAVVMWVLIGILVSLPATNSANFIVTAVLLGLTIVALTAKITLVVVRKKADPVLPRMAVVASTAGSDTKPDPKPEVPKPEVPKPEGVEKEVGP
ncbi:uncharacterized protein LOC124149662 [Haliotis rufescens]|uniref:uncharacterized protein LOC124149662 n=1 Tax=Haliotis rufescens TaxID=6454 RepID=UPI00201ECFC8|nr:uncharacterized protein LOC124149662 [Haliotis rufescens]